MGQNNWTGRRKEVPLSDGLDTRPCKILDPRLLQVMVKNLEKEILLLKRELAMHDTLANRSQVSHEALSEQQRYEIRQQVKAYLDGNADDIDVRE